MPTFGYSSPNSITQNLDTVLTLAFANSGDQVFDAISKNNPIFHEIKKNKMYEGVSEPQPYIEIALMYGLGTAEWYEGWDTLGTQPTEGITGAVYPWRQIACPVAISRREQRITNPARIKEIVKAKMEQAELTMVEAFAKALLQGNIPNGGSATSNFVSPSTSRSGIEPIAELIAWASGSASKPTASLEIGGLNQSTYAWWRNWSRDLSNNSGAGNVSTYAAFLLECDRMFENCSKGPGGSPDLILTDHETKVLLNAAYYDKYRRNLDSQNDYPFDNLKFRGAKVIADENMINVYAGTADTSTSYGGTMYFINSKFLKMKYDTEANFSMTPMQKPVNQDGKVGHSLWMGNLCVTNRRKHGVIGGIARSLS